MAGVKVNAFIAEKAVDTAIVSANCLYSSPVMPEINAVGINTAMSTNATPITGPCNSYMAFSAAWRGVCLPWSRMRAQFSTTIIASSTTIAMASTKPNSVSVLMVNPSNFITANVAMSDTGIVIIGMITARQFCRNSNITIITMIVVSSSVRSTSAIEASTNSVVLSTML